MGMSRDDPSETGGETRTTEADDSETEGRKWAPEWTDDPTRRRLLYLLAVAVLSAIAVVLDRWGSKRPGGSKRADGYGNGPCGAGGFGE